MTFLTVWQQDFKDSERLPQETVQVLFDQGVISYTWKPNRKGKMKPVLVSHYAFAKIRDLSCQMGPRVIEGNAMGFWRCVSATKAWAR